MQVGTGHSASIILKDVTKQYKIASLTVEALRSIDLEIPSGQLVAVSGKSGAGKSTLLHVVGTLDRATTGTITLAGTEVMRLTDHQISCFRNQRIGFVFQNNNLLPEFTALENIMMPGLIGGKPRDQVKARAHELLAKVGLAARAEHRPGELSGGEQQRVAIARALVMSPPLLLADEPTGNLDLKTSMAIQDLLIDVCEQHRMTMLLVTHDDDFAQRLPHRIFMEDGRIVSGGQKP